MPVIVSAHVCEVNAGKWVVFRPGGGVWEGRSDCGMTNGTQDCDGACDGKRCVVVVVAVQDSGASLGCDIPVCSLQA